MKRDYENGSNQMATGPLTEPAITNIPNSSYNEARSRTFTEIENVVKEAKIIHNFGEIIVSARRIATIFFPCLTPSAVSFSQIYAEASYLEKNCPDENAVRESLDFFNRILYASTPLIHIHAYRELARLGSRFSQLDIGDFISVIERRLLDCMEWNLNVNSISSTDSNIWTEDIMHYMATILSKIPMLIIDMFEPQISLFSFEDDLTIDPFTIPPEEAVMQKQDLQELVALIQTLPYSKIKMLEDLITGSNGFNEEGLLDLRKTLDNMLSYDLKSFQQVKKEHHNKRYTRGLTDPNGLSIFHNLELGQVYWIISHLPKPEKQAIFHKLGYINSDQNEIHNGETSAQQYNRTHSAKKMIINYLRGVEKDQIPILQTPVSSLIEDSRSKKSNHGEGSSLGHCRRIIIEASQQPDFPAVNSRLTSRQQQVISLVQQGLPNLVIASELNIHPSRVADHISTISRLLKAKYYQELLSNFHSNP